MSEGSSIEAANPVRGFQMTLHSFRKSKDNINAFQRTMFLLFLLQDKERIFLGSKKAA